MSSSALFLFLFHLYVLARVLKNCFAQGCDCQQLHALPSHGEIPSVIWRGAAGTPIAGALLTLGAAPGPQHGSPWVGPWVWGCCAELHPLITHLGLCVCSSELTRCEFLLCTGCSCVSPAHAHVLFVFPCWLHGVPLTHWPWAQPYLQESPSPSQHCQLVPAQSPVPRVAAVGTRHVPVTPRCRQAQSPAWHRGAHPCQPRQGADTGLWGGLKEQPLQNHPLRGVPTQRYLLTNVD